MEEREHLVEELNQLRKENSELRRRVTELTDFIENAAIPLHWVDKDGIIVWANQAELDALGYTADEYIGSSIASYHADADVIGDILTRLTNNETLNNYPARLRRKDGTIRHVLISSNVLRENGEFVHTRCFTKDITAMVEEEQRRSELMRKLEESEARLRQAIEAIKLGTWDWDTQTGEMYLSTECRRILGLSGLEAISVEEFLAQVHTDDRSRLESEVNRLMQGTSSNQFDVSYRFRRLDDGELRWLRTQGTLFVDDENRPDRFAGTMLDVTDARMADEKDARLVAIIESSNDAIVGKTLQGCVTSWNPAAQHIFGFTEEEMVGQSIVKIIPDDRVEEESFILSRLGAGENIAHFETKRQRKDGRLIDVSLTISPIRDSAGRIIGASKIARDITEKKLEEQRKNDFVAMVSHEMKTPLTSILLYTQLLMKNARKNEDRTGLQMGSRMEAHIKKMILMVQDYLSLARIEEGKIELRQERFDLCPLLEEIVQDAQLLSARHRITLTGCNMISLFGDRDKIGQVLINLVNNAIKYSPSGGSIHIECELRDGAVRIAVRDEGIGISEVDQKKLFQRFYRVTNEKVRNIAGFGIGLYLVAEILRYHGSAIEVESREGEGSTFSFELQLAS